MPATRLSLRPVPLLALCLAVTGCPGELDDPERFTTTCPDITGELFGQSCAGSGCHNAVDQAGGLDLASAGVEGRLVGAPASAACGGGALIDPQSPTASVLYRKLTTSYCGQSQMPPGEPLTAAELECVRAWIAGLTSSSSSSGSSSSSSGEL